MSNFSLKGKVILLTGAAGRFGQAMTRAMTASGAEVIAAGRNQLSLQSLYSPLSSAQQAHCHVKVCDITDEADRTRLIEQIKDQFGKLHGLVNNAYTGRTGQLDSIGPDDFRLANEISLVAPFELIRSCQDLLRAAATESGHHASVVNISTMYALVSPDPSVYGDSGKNNPVHYGAAKAGMLQMTRYLACHLGNQGIRVNSITPGPFPDLSVDPGIPDFYAQLADKVPMGRVGDPSEMAGPVIFLLSDAASYVNGANLKVDGGWTAW